jgi:hypothetical protein
LVLFYGRWFLYKESLPPLGGKTSTSTITTVFPLL